MSNDELAVWKKWNTAKIIHGVLQEAPACSQSCDVATSEFPAKQLLEHVGIWVDLNAAIAAKLPNAEYSFGIDNFDAEKNSIEQYIRAEWKTQLPFGYSHSEIKTENTSPAIIASIFPTDYFQSFKINTSSYIWGSPLTHPELKGREYHGFLLPKLKNNHNQRGEVNELYQGGSNPKSESHDKNTKIGALVDFSHYDEGFWTIFGEQNDYDEAPAKQEILVTEYDSEPFVFEYTENDVYASRAEMHHTHADAGSDTAQALGLEVSVVDVTANNPSNNHNKEDTSSHHSGDENMGTVSNGPLPTYRNQVEDYVRAVKAEGEHVLHSDEGHKAAEHSRLLELVPRSDATHIAVGSGDWFDADNWYNGEIPDAGAKVLIPKDTFIVYNDVSEESLFSVRVDGELSFATDVETKLVVDTFVVSSTGRLKIGTEENPIQEDVSAEIVFANNGNIDVGWDPSLLSRGLISIGQVEIHGAEKTTYMRVADSAMAGDTQIELSDVPDNWQIGDTIVITGTHKQGWFYNTLSGKKEFAESQDEEVTITAIDESVITIDRPLVHDHDTPRDDLLAVVANLTRNVTFRSHDGDETEMHHRGHVMFMHNRDVDVRYAAFEDLGRTDKSSPAHHLNSLEQSDIQSDTNAQGRYSFHFHKTGTEDQSNPAIALGNAVSGSPGWGFVHHSSHANFIENIAFDVFGASFVAEDGDETGVWWRNVAIKTEGIGYGSDKTKSGRDVNRDDVGRTGDGFFFSGRMVEAAENIAANTTHGFVWMTRTSSDKPNTLHTDFPDAFYGQEFVRSQDWVPIQGFSDNEAFGTQVGLIVVKRSIEQNHEVRSVLDGFLNWETSSGIDLTYTSHYTLKNIDLIGTKNDLPVGNAQDGFQFGAQVFDIVVNGLKVSNFKVGIDFTQFTKRFWTDSDIDHVIIDAHLENNLQDYRGYDSERHTILTSEDLVADQLNFAFTGDSTIGLWDSIAFDGVKTDSIGERDRQFASDIQKISFSKNILKILETDGYFKTTDGRNIMILEDYIADRATGELSKISHIITLDISDAQLSGFGITSNGIFDFDNVAPVAADDYATVHNASSVIIDVLANDSDVDGDILSVDSFTNPSKGDLRISNEGKIVYEPFHDYLGTDTFDYWVTDDQGHFSRATVVIDVFEFI